MSGTLIGGLSQISRVASGFNQLTSDISGLLGGGSNSYSYVADPEQAGAWITNLLPASWRGVPFGVTDTQYTGGRKVSVHEYPFRDIPWVEDLGRATRAFSFSAFLSGDDVYTQTHRFLGACEAKGYGTLVLPTLGPRTVSLVAPAKVNERLNEGRVVRIELEFVETRGPSFPGSKLDTSGGISLASAGAFLGIPASFTLGAESSIVRGIAAVQGGIRTAQGFAGATSRLVGDAGLITHAVTGLQAPQGTTYGRYALGGGGSVQAATATAQTALSAGVTAASAVRNAANSAAQLARLL